MNGNLRVYFLDNQNNNIFDEQTIVKPLTYEDLLDSIRESIIEVPDSFKIFYYTNNNNLKIIQNNDDYKLINDLIFIVDSNNDNLVENQSFEMIYNQLSESKRDIYDTKYNCKICESLINNEIPYFCYSCQNIFHIDCLKHWENQRNAQNLMLNCPFCKKELPLRDWKRKLYFEENKKNDEKLLRELNQFNNNSNNI